MNVRSRFVAAIIALSAPIAVVVAAAAGPFTILQFNYHDMDEEIISALGYDAGAIVYYREFGSITREQSIRREEYERIGCHPFSVLRNGETVEEGYNCRTFFCVGYKKGPRICRDSKNRPYGGVVEIQNRLNMPVVNDEKKFFSQFPAAERTATMQQRMDQLRPLLCAPFYLYHFDVAVGEGYDCEEVGKYPYFSAENSCVIDWRRGDKEYQCEVPLRPDEEKIRRDAIFYRGNGIPSSGTGSSASSLSRASTRSVSSSSSSRSVVSSGSSSVPGEFTFPDVLVGKYGYTAITDLARNGIVRGYANGLFRPDAVVNRAEFAKMVIEGLYPSEFKSEINCFPDVINEWYAGYVCAMKRLGWVKGYADGMFKPDRTISRAEGIKMVVAALYEPLDSTIDLPPGVPANAWFSPYIREALELRILLEPTFYPQAQSTRADTAVWVYRARKVQAER